MTCEGQRHILSIEGLSVTFRQYERGWRQTELPVIRELDVYVHVGEIVAVVGASGSGKSLLAHAVLGILPPNARWSGRIEYDEAELTPAKLARLRGSEIVFIPQSVNYLDPLMRVGPQVLNGKNHSRRRAEQRDTFARYGLEPRAEKLFPFELSGGMARRVLVSAATLERPRLIVADEPTPGLHEAAARETLSHLRELADGGAGVLLITHDLELALQVSDRIAVFYAGTTVEEAPVGDFRDEALLRHPYTQALWRALPQNGFRSTPGTQPYAGEMLAGCPFRPRCERATPECAGAIASRLIRCGTVRCLHAT